MTHENTLAPPVYERRITELGLTIVAKHVLEPEHPRYQAPNNNKARPMAWGLSK